MSDASLADALPSAPVLAPLDIRFANGPRGDDGAALRFEQANAMALEIVNRTIHDMTFTEVGDGHHLELAFRPHTLLDPESVRLAPSSVEDGWNLSAHDPAEHGHRQLYRLRRRAGEVLRAGATEHVHLEEVRADPFGGARGTQASVNYTGLGLARDGAPLSGHLLLRLALLGADDTAGANGAIDDGTSELFRARFSDGGATLLGDGTLNAFWIGIANDSTAPLELRGGDDTAARFVFDLSEAEHNGAIEFAIATADVPDGWESIDLADDEEVGTVLRPRGPYTWEPGRYLWFRATMTCNIDHGRHPLRIRYENMPPEGLRSGAITLMQRFGPFAQTNHRSYASKPIELVGTEAQLLFSYGDLNVSTATSARLSVSPDERTKGKLTIHGDTAHGIEVASARLSLSGGRLGIGGGVPEAPIHIQEGVTDAALSSGGGLVIGSLAGTNLCLDDNEIMARNDGAAARLSLNWDGGAVNIGGKLALGQQEPEAPVHVQSGYSDVKLSGGGGVVVGRTSGANLAIDTNEIMARDGGAPATLYLNAEGGHVTMGGDTEVAGELSAGSLSTGPLSAGFVEITGSGDISATSGADRGLVVGAVDGNNVAVDGNEIMARDGGEPSTLYLNADGGALSLGRRSDLHIRVDGSEIYARNGRSRSTLFLQRGGQHSQFGGEVGIAKVPVWDGPGQNDVTWSHDGVISREGSSKRYKKDVRTLEDDFTALLKVKPRRFHMKKGYGEPDAEMFGYIAEEMDDLGLERLVEYDDQGRPDGVRYKKLAIYLTEIVKTQEARIAALEASVEKLAQASEPAKGAVKGQTRKSRTGGKGRS